MAVGLPTSKSVRSTRVPKRISGVSSPVDGAPASLTVYERLVPLAPLGFPTQMFAGEHFASVHSSTGVSAWWLCQSFGTAAAL